MRRSETILTLLRIQFESTNKKKLAVTRATRDETGARMEKPQVKAAEILQESGSILSRDT